MAQSVNARLISPAKVPATTPPPLDGVWAAADTRLDACELFPLPAAAGPEDVAIDAAGRLLAGAEDGSIWRWAAGARPGDKPELLVSTGGRPLGIELDPTDGSLIVCDADRGLLRVTDDGNVTLLADQANGKRILVCNNADVCRDGTVYFTDSSDRYTLSRWKDDLLEHRPNGRVLRWAPGMREAEEVATGFYFPNGVALTPDESALLMVETVSHRLVSIDLSTAQVSTLTDLPAYPDNMAQVGDGTYWIALPSPRLKIAESLLPHPGLRRTAALLPDWLQPQPKKYGLVAQVDLTGRVLRTLHGPRGRYWMITGVRQQGEHLWLGSLYQKAVARVSLS